MKKILRLLFLMVFVVFTLTKVGYSQSLNENFDGTTFPPTDWVLVAGSGNWDQSNQTSDHTTGSDKFARYNCYNINGTSEAMLVTPVLTVTASDKTFSFWANYYFVSGTYGSSATLYVDVSADDGSTWTNGTTDIISGHQGGGWLQTTIDLGNYEGQNFVGSDVKVRFRASSDYGSYNIAIDDVSGPAIWLPSCPQPTNQSVTNIATTGAQLNWTSGGSTNFNIEYGLFGFTQGTGTLLSVATDTFAVLTSLSFGTAYEWYVQDTCGVADVSLWAGPNTFITVPGPHAFPLFEDFDSATFKFVNNINSTVSFIDETTIVHSGTHSRSCAYTSNNVNVLHETGMLDLSATSYPMVEFWHIAKTENSWDKCFVEISTDGGATYVTLDDSLYEGGSANYSTKGYFDESAYSDWSGSTLDNTWWKKEKFDLAPFKQDSVRIRFRMTSDGSVQRAGWFIDDISVREQPANEIAIVEILGNFGGFGVTSAETVSVVVKNNGILTQTSIPMKYTLDNGTIASETMTILPAFSLDTFTFATTYDATIIAIHTLNIYTDLVIDEDRTNDTLTLSFETNDTTDVPSNHGFDSIPDFHFNLISQSQSTVLYDMASNNGVGYGIHMYGGNTYWSPNPTTVTEAFAITDHVASVDALVDATANLSLFVDLDYKMTHTYTNNKYSWFRVLINDSIYAKSLAGDSVWNANSIASDPWETLTLNLNSFAGTVFSISYQGAMKYDGSYSSTYPNGDAIFIDNISYYEPPQNDLAVVKMLSPVSGLCGNVATVVEVVVENRGVIVQNNVVIKAIISFPSGAVDTVVGTSGLIPVFGSDTVLLSAFDASLGGVYSVTSFASLATDQKNSNDTLNTSFTITDYITVDFIDDFEGSSLDWVSNGFYVYASHGKTGKGLYKNFWSSSPIGNATMTKKIGPIPSGASLTFDYRVVNYSLYPDYATILDADSFFFMLSTDCGTTYDTIYVVDSTNHTNTTSWTNRQIALPSYVGQSVLLKIDVKYATGDYFFDIDNIGIARPPTVDLGGDKLICGTDTITIDATNNSTYAYLWTVDNDTLAATTSSIQTDSIGVYTVEVTSPLGMDFDTITVTAATMPTVSVTSVDSMCYGDSAEVVINFTGASPWVFGITDGVNSFSDSSITAAYTAYPDPNVTTSYIITSLVDGNGCSLSGNLDTAKVVVNAIPTVNVVSVDTMCYGDSAEVVINFTGASPWVFGITDGVNSFSDSSTTASYTGYPDPDSTTSYIITSLVDGNGCAALSGDLDTATVVVKALPTINVVSVDTMCYGDSAEVVINFTGASPWVFGITDGVNSFSDSSTTASYTGYPDPDSTTSYIITSLVDGNGCAALSGNLDTATIVVNPLPSFSTSLSNDTICSGDSALLDLNFTGASPWSFDVNIGGVTTGFVTPIASIQEYVSPIVTTNYKIISITDGNGCSISGNIDSVLIEVNALPYVTFGSSFGPYCNNGVVDTISAYPIGGIFTGTGMTDSIFDPMTAGVGDHQIMYSYTDANTQCSSSVMDTATVVAAPVLSVSNDTTICEGSNVMVSAYTTDVNDTYLWSTGATTSSINVVPIVDTTYFVTASNVLCQAMDSVNIMVNPSPKVNLGPDTSFKWTYESITLDAGNPSATWLWSTGGTTQTETFDNSNLNKGANTVYVDVTENNCSASDTVIIIVIDDVSINGALSNINLKVYPNPSNGQFNMAINGFEGAAEISVVDISGQVVYTEKINIDANYVNKFDLHSLATGIYYIKLTTDKGIKVEKLIIK